MTSPITQKRRFEVFRRDGFRCTYCGATANDTKLVIDHIHPRKLGGTNAIENLTTACEPRNLGKSATPLTAQTAPRAPDLAKAWHDAIEDAYRVRTIALADIAADTVARLDNEWLRWSCGTDHRTPVPRPAHWEDDVEAAVYNGADPDYLVNLVQQCMTIRKVRPGMVYTKHWLPRACNHVNRMQMHAFESLGLRDRVEEAYQRGHEVGYREGLETGRATRQGPPRSLRDLIVTVGGVA